MKRIYLLLILAVILCVECSSLIKQPIIGPGYVSLPASKKDTGIIVINLSSPISTRMPVANIYLDGQELLYGHCDPNCKDGQREECNICYDAYSKIVIENVPIGKHEISIVPKPMTGVQAQFPSIPADRQTVDVVKNETAYLVFNTTPIQPPQDVAQGVQRGIWGFVIGAALLGGLILLLFGGG